MSRIIAMSSALALIASIVAGPARAQATRLAYSCQAECQSNVSVCLKYIEACHQPGVGCEYQRAQCMDTQACVRTCR
jgi:hypothetical protein